MSILRLGERLVRSGAITSEQLDLLAAEQKRSGQRLTQLVVELGFASAERVAETVAEISGSPYLPLQQQSIEEELAALVDEEIARKHQLVPVRRIENRLTVAVANPTNIIGVDQLRQSTGLDIEVVVSPEGQIADAQDQLYLLQDHRGLIEEQIDRAEQAMDEIGDTGVRELGAVIELVEGLIREGFRRRATDIHMEPEERLTRVRYRVDGVLLSGPSLPTALHTAVMARTKILAGLDIGESRLPQDGRIRLEIGRKKIDLRVSTIPTIRGENLVLRVLDKSNVVLGLDAIGMGEQDLENLLGLLSTQTGMILVTGPTGSGKTTTLYSALSSLDAVRNKVATLEDPVEYELPMIRQSQVNEKTGFGFSSGLRALLRQDPDIIFVGEMRDGETASIAVRAAMTGHLVMSTLHTTSALGTLPRLVQMGVPVELLTTSVRGLLAQRLVRVICDSCVREHRPDPAVVRRLGLDQAPPGLLAGHGCDACSGTGYRGRTGLYELVRMTPTLAQAFGAGCSMGELAVIAAADGTRFLRQHGLELASAGRTTLEEVLRATADAPSPDRPEARPEADEAVIADGSDHA